MHLLTSCIKASQKSLWKYYLKKRLLTSLDWIYKMGNNSEKSTHIVCQSMSVERDIWLSTSQINYKGIIMVAVTWSSVFHLGVWLSLLANLSHLKIKWHSRRCEYICNAVTVAEWYMLKLKLVRLSLSHSLPYLF